MRGTCRANAGRGRSGGATLGRLPRRGEGVRVSPEVRGLAPSVGAVRFSGKVGRTSCALSDNMEARSVSPID